ncbi:hypothetical protein IHE44_0011431, partial [Lamprotornis superbus]
SINPFSLQKQFEASVKTLQEEDECSVRLTEAAKETRQEMLVDGAAVWVHPSSSFMPQTRVSAEKQKLRAMLKGLCWLLSDQKSRFHSQFHCLSCGEAARDVMDSALPCKAPGQVSETSNHDPGSSHSSPPNPGVIGWLDCRPLGITPSSSCPQEWSILSVSAGFWALSRPSPTSLPHNHTLQRIEVALDCAGGRVAFRDADSQTEIFAFPPAAFAGEQLQPLLWLGEGQLCSPFVPESPRNPPPKCRRFHHPNKHSTQQLTAPLSPQPHFIFLITSHLTITFHTFASQWENRGCKQGERLQTEFHPPFHCL